MRAGSRRGGEAGVWFIYAKGRGVSRIARRPVGSGRLASVILNEVKNLPLNPETYHHYGGSNLWISPHRKGWWLPLKPGQRRLRTNRMGAIPANRARLPGSGMAVVHGSPERRIV